MRFGHILEESGLTSVWWELAENPKANFRLILKAAARRVVCAHQLANPPISHHVLLRAIELELVRDAKETLTFRLSIFLLNILAWYLLLNGGGHSNHVQDCLVLLRPGGSSHKRLEVR